MDQCVIFDLDGVIIDSEPVHKICEKEIFRMLGISISEFEHNAFIGVTDEMMWSQIVNSYSLSIKVPEIIKIKKSLYMEYLKLGINIKPVQYVSELISDLYRNDFLLIVASSSPHEQIDFVLSNFGLTRYFHYIVSGEDVKTSKPHPDIFIKAAKFVGVEPKSCVVIEDSFNGLMAAKSANMRCIGYKNPNSGNQDLSEADVVVHSLKEISVSLIKELL